MTTEGNAVATTVVATPPPTPAASSGLESRHRIRELDGLRALAVAAVISFHYTVGTPLETRWAKLGWAGVDLFFVLSGFLITGILLSTRERPRYYSTFYLRRFLRIVPAYALVLSTLWIGARLVSGPQPIGFWLMHVGFLSSSLGFFKSWSLNAPLWVMGGTIVLWSLSVEEHFYLFWAPLVKLLGQRRQWLELLLGAMIVGAPLLRALLHRPWFPEYYYFPARMDALAFGALVALVVRRAGQLEGGLDRLRRASWPLVAGSLAAFLILVYRTGGGRDNFTFAVFGYTLLGMLAAALVLATALSAGTHGQAKLHGPSLAGWSVNRAWSAFMRTRPMQQLGKTSYMVYLIHYPMVFLVMQTLQRHWPRFHGRNQTIVQDAVALVLTLLITEASWRWYVAPILRLKERFA